MNNASVYIQTISIVLLKCPLTDPYRNKVDNQCYVICP